MLIAPECPKNPLEDAALEAGSHIEAGGFGIYPDRDSVSLLNADLGKIGCAQAVSLDKVFISPETEFEHSMRQQPISQTVAGGAVSILLRSESDATEIPTYQTSIKEVVGRLGDTDWNDPASEEHRQRMIKANSRMLRMFVSGLDKKYGIHRAVFDARMAGHYLLDTLWEVDSDPSARLANVVSRTMSDAGIKGTFAAFYGFRRQRLFGKNFGYPATLRRLSLN